MPMRAISAGLRPSSGWPRKVMLPPAAGTSPMMVLHSVVLPMPLRPTTDSTPDFSRKSTPCKAWDAP